MAPSESMHSCRAVDLGFFETAPESFRYEIVLTATPARVFEVFEDEDSWPVWADAILRVAWTTPKPFAVGTKRTVDLRGGLSADEYFIAWEPNERMAFYFERTNKPVLRAFAEDYQLEALPNGKTKLVWRVAFESRGLMAYVSPLLRPIVRTMLGRMMKGLDRYLNNHPTQTATRSVST